MVSFFFFFQAEDGIRDGRVTGVQTCALPISLGHLPVRMITYGAVDRTVHAWISDGCGRSTVKNSLAVLVRVMEQAVRDGIIDRSEERRVGKECRSRWAAEH